jgi:hypothetical protein
MTFWKTVGANLVAQMIAAAVISLLYIGIAAMLVADLATKHPAATNLPS